MGEEHHSRLQPAEIPGIVGASKALPDADLLPGAHGWTDPAVMVWVERIS